ncbi:OmpA family protein [Cellulomonas fengjieae]|uniref:OmpA family protein n=1 Tax=Cellulomonas fengjieae TaxID=2819978 RepID=A0ABS3SJ61_9CELL|nr:OmpA family protein [Cellulomonas fengjieae]MBO3084981.1 OmpA family protein [Cellulomonas fengjieae]MBO3100728.1 OmpA family protein [Cellulomonas fengjieae]QVI66421.1 OmpA family protein [Cellulomonas fengjieae]
MPHPARTTVRTSLSAVLAVLACVACSPDEPPVPPQTDRPSASPTPAAADPVTAEVVLGGEPMSLEIGPVAVTDDVGVLRIAGPADAQLQTGLWDVFISSSPGANGVRLVDLAEGTVATPARTANDRALATWVMSVGGPATDAAAEAAGEETQVQYVAFAAPTTATVGVLLPHGGGLVQGVPVTEAEDAGVLTIPVSEIHEDAVATAPVAALDTYSESAGGQVRTRSTEETVTVAIGSDVLFGVDSADLGPQSDAALTAAAQQVAAYDGGSLAVVGHTDDVADDAYNEALSERRAQAVADRLASIADLGAFDVSVEGRGESEPAARGTSDQERAVNRRVELVLTTLQEQATQTSEAPAGTLPETTGPVASGEGTVTIDSGNGVPVDIGVREVRRVGRFLVGSVEVSNTAGAQKADGSLFSAGPWGARGSLDAALLQAATNLTLVHGEQRFYPVDYLVGEERRSPLADRIVDGPEPGTTIRVTVVWPDPGTESVVVDSPAQRKEFTDTVSIDLGVQPFRITDVPVVEES